MGKIDRTCKECISYVRNECVGKTNVCHKWVYKKANCRLCVFLDDCFKLGKGVSETKVCLNFEKSKTFPKNLDDYTSELSSVEEETFSPVELVENIISSDYDARVFQLIDDRDIPKCSNPVKFIISKKFLGIDLFPMQLKIFIEFFSAVCAWCSDMKYLKNIKVDTKVDNILDRMVPYKFGVCPKCHRTRYEAFEAGKIERYDNLVGVSGQRSGKSISVGILAATVLHQFLTLKGSPVEYFGLLANSTLHGTFVGLRYADAFDNLWEPFYNLVKSSRWYQQYHSFLQSEGQRIGVELVKVRDTFIAYKWKNIGIYPSGPDRRTLRGRTRIIACLSGPSLIATTTGLVRIDKITLDHLVIVRNKSYEIKYTFYNGEQHTFNLTTQQGYSISATRNHKFLTIDNKWKKLSELVIGDILKVTLDDNFITYDRIESIIYAGIKKVYDLEIDSEEHAYVANGFIVHNSIDEMGWFMGSDGSMKLDPDEVYNALDNSLMTVQTKSRKMFRKHPDIPTAVGMYISSPSSKTDKSMRMLKQAQNSPRLYGFHSSTWNFNPNITRADLQQKFNEDPIAAERDFGANPPFGISPFIKGPSSLIPVFSDEKNCFINSGYKVLEGSLNESLLYPKISFKSKHTYPSVLSIDCSYNSNSFACVLSHLELDGDEKKFVVSGIIEIVPVPFPISFVAVYEKVITRIIENFNVQIVTFDRWQSIDMSQRVFKDYGIPSFWYSVKYAEFELFKSEVYGGTLQFPKLESSLDDLIELDAEMSSLTTLKPANHLFLQLLMCKDTGRMVTKGDDVTDDILRALVLGYAIINKEEYEELFTGIGNSINTNYANINSIIRVGMKSVSNVPSNMPNFGFQNRTTSVSGVGSFRGKYSGLR